MLRADGTVLSERGFHQATQVGDLFYDSLTGLNGATWETYQTLIQNDRFHPLVIKPPRQYIPPQP